MPKMIQKWLQFFLVWFNGKKTEPKIAQSKAKDVEEAGRWYFKRDILDRLDECCKDMKRLKRTNREMYNLYKNTGAILSSGRAMMETKLSPKWLQNARRPGFGAVTFGYAKDKKDEDWIPLRLVMFMKINNLTPHIQAALGTIYRVGYFYVDPKNPSHTTYGEYHVAVNENGRVVLLKQNVVERQKINTKNKRKHQESKFYINKHKWDYPAWLVNVYDDVKSKYSDKKDWDVWDSFEKWIQSAFSVSMFLFENAQNDIRIRAEKNGVCVVFSVDLLRTPYFFKDRDFVPAKDGRRKRIFHIVRTHRRNLRDGSVQNVKCHFRGQRRFFWNGYRINITMPGFHHTDIQEFNAQAYEEGMDVPGKMMDTKEAGKRIGETMNV